MNKPMPEFYPYVLLPEEIEKIKIEGIPVPELKELPDEPEKPKKRFLGTIVLFISIALMILFGTTHIIKSGFWSSIVIFLIFFISLVSLTAAVFELLQNRKTKKQYRIDLKLYKEQIEEIETLKEKRRKAIEDNNNPKAIDAYRHTTINNYFKYSYNKIQISQREYTPAQKRFLIFLEQYFEDKILENSRIVHEIKQIDYSPDFILKLDSPKVNIAIDIEEPYSIENGKIIIKKNRAEETFKIRYKVTNELRWVCITFSEEQVVTHPTESCKLIASTIDEILLKEKYVLKFKDVGKLKRVEIPGQRELSAFMRNKYRENYLIAAGLIDEADVVTSEVEIRAQGKDKPEKIIKTVHKDNEKEKNTTLNDTSKNIIVEKKTDIDADIEQLKIAKKATEKIKNETKDKPEKEDKKQEKTETGEKKPEKPEIGKKQIESLKKQPKTEKKEEQPKSKVIDLNKKKQDVKKELLKSIETKLESEKKSGNGKRVSLKKEAERLNLLYSKTKANKEDESSKEDKELLEKNKAERERLEKERQEKVKQEKEHLEQKKKEEKEKKELSLAEKAKLKRDQIEKERLAKEKEQKERLEKERQEKVKQEKERLVKEKAEKERLEKERIAREKAEKERLEKERVAKEKAEKERLEKERTAKEKAEKERLEKERIAKEKAEKERLEKERKEKELAEKVKVEKERIEKMQKELEEKQKVESRNKLKEKYKTQIEKLVSEKNWDMLFDVCNEAIKEFPLWDWPYYRRSTMHGNKGQFVDAIEDCNKALSINPKLTDAVYNRATAKFYLKKYEEALEDYQKCIELNYRNSAEAHFNKGLCYQNLNQSQKAYAEFVKAKNLGNIKAIEILNTQY